MNRPASSGAASERTSLAWRRTALAFAVNSVLLLRSSEPWLQVAALSVLAAAAGLTAISSSAFLEPQTRGWLAGRKHRPEILVLLAAAVGCLDLVAITR